MTSTCLLIKILSAVRPDVTSSPGMESSPLAHRNDVMREKRESVRTSDPMVHWEKVVMSE